MTGVQSVGSLIILAVGLEGREGISLTGIHSARRQTGCNPPTRLDRGTERPGRAGMIVIGRESPLPVSTWPLRICSIHRIRDIAGNGPTAPYRR